MSIKTTEKPHYTHDIANMKTDEFMPDSIELLSIISIQSKRLDDAHSRLNKAFNKISELEENQKNFNTKFHHIYNVINCIMGKIHKFSKMHHYTRSIAYFCRSLLNPISILERNSKRDQIKRNKQLRDEANNYKKLLRVEKIQKQLSQRPFIQAARKNNERLRNGK